MKAIQPITHRFRLLLGMLTLSLMAFAQPALAAINGLWTIGSGDYLVLMQDVNSGLVVGLQIDTSYTSLAVWTGSATDTTLTLTEVANSANSINATFTTATSLEGRIIKSGTTTPFSAQFSLAYSGSANDGIWQRPTDTGSQSYIAFFTLAAGNGKLPIEFDITIDPGLNYSYDVIAGITNNNVFTGTSVMNANLTSRLAFDSGTLDGTQISSGKMSQPVTTNFTATQIIKLAK
ncbi:hypothetical protein [Parachitinimonas caeni]|uniref:Uncharacterized protein n=1 Tax=Parachitinimonas caeni TaxID=3031301 RepID=A0ABT7DY01_9NEIS|nr:hypothetical protein [Parachitinimonas caeni]MDK2123522.1 hypothetical protein [Parachitinimonas caeni]